MGQSLSKRHDGDENSSNDDDDDYILSPEVSTPPNATTSSLHHQQQQILIQMQGEVFRRTRTIKQIACIDYDEFLNCVKDLNKLSSHFLDENGKQLIFAVKRGTDTTVLWKATVKVACVKVDSASKNIDSYRPLSLKEFLQVYNSLQHQVAAVGEGLGSSILLDSRKRKTFLSTWFESPSAIVNSDLVHLKKDKEESQGDEDEEDNATSLEECCICLERKPNIILPCAHSYCLPCIERWNVDHKTCPVCREIVTSTDDSWVISDVPDSAEIVTEIQKSLMELAH